MKATKQDKNPRNWIVFIGMEGVLLWIKQHLYRIGRSKKKNHHFTEVPLGYFIKCSLVWSRSPSLLFVHIMMSKRSFLKIMLYCLFVAGHETDWACSGIQMAAGVQCIHICTSKSSTAKRPGMKKNTWTKKKPIAPQGLHYFTEVLYSTEI